MLVSMGMVYFNYVLPDVVIVMHRRNRYSNSDNTNTWEKYGVRV